MDRHDLYDLVKVIDPDDNQFYGALGIIINIDRDIDGYELYELIYVGKTHNRLAEKEGPLFYADELEGI